MKIRKVLCLIIMFFYTAQTFAATCTKLSETCVDGPSTKIISGVSVYRTCWQYQDTYDCSSASQQSDCQALIDKGCGQISSTCVNTLSDGSCDTYEQQYSCVKSPATTNTVTDCGTQTFCQNGECFNSGSKPDTDFGQAITGLELQRQFGQYTDNGITVFNGVNNTCNHKLGNLVNCCSTSGGSGQGASNMALMMSSAYKAASTTYNAIGSSYVYDALFESDAPNWVVDGFDSLFGAGGTSSVLASWIAGDVSTTEMLSSFVPGWWTIIILIIEYSGILSCPDDSKVLAMKRDNNLCHMVGSYCSATVPVINSCIQTTESYCCYNSKLSKIINEQGRPQLGKSYGTPQNTDCSGFTPAELQKLDFSKMDFSEFIKDIQPQLPAQGDQQTLIQNKVNSYYAQ